MTFHNHLMDLQFRLETFLFFTVEGNEQEADGSLIAIDVPLVEIISRLLSSLSELSYPRTFIVGNDVKAKPAFSRARPLSNISLIFL